jgi:hypothetical protein
MGFYSWDCEVCGHPLISAYALEDKNAWMNQGVALFEDGSVMKGEYDGYGRLNDREIDGCPQVYHEACWHLAGKPTDYTGESESSRDQGYFFDDNVHNFDEPESLETAEMLKVVSSLHNKIHAQSWKICHLEMMIAKGADAFEKSIDADLVDIQNDDIREDIIEPLGKLIEHRDDMDRKENERNAEKNGLDVETYVEIKEAYMGLNPDVIFGYMPIKHARDKVYKIYKNDYMYEELDLETGNLSEVLYEEDEVLN